MVRPGRASLGQCLGNITVGYSQITRGIDDRMFGKPFLPGETGLAGSLVLGVTGQLLLPGFASFTG